MKQDVLSKTWCMNCTSDMHWLPGLLSVSCWDPDHPHCICASFHPGYLLKLSLPGSSLTADRIFFALGFTPARLTPLQSGRQDNSSRQLLCPCLPSCVPLPCWGTHNSHHCQDPMLPIYGPILSILRILQTEKWMKNNDCTLYLVVIWGAKKLQSELYKLWRWWLTPWEGPSPEQCLRVLVLTSAAG